MDGWQQERADNWLPGGQVWLKSHPDQAVEVRFDGEIHENWDHGFHYIQHTNYNSVMAIPSDMYVQGYDGKGVAKLRLWQAKAPDFDMSLSLIHISALKLGCRTVMTLQLVRSASRTTPSR